MKNTHYERGLSTVIELWDYQAKQKRDCWIDTADLPKLLSLPYTWYAQPARKSKAKIYAQAKHWDATTKRSRTVLLHRILLNLTDPAVEAHHIDNDGLNNQRRNLEPLSHAENCGRRRTKPQPNRALAAEYRSERSIAAQIMRTNNLTRQQLWKIRTYKTLGSHAALAYSDAIRAAGIRSLAALQQAHPREGKWGANA